MPTYVYRPPLEMIELLSVHSPERDASDITLNTYERTASRYAALSTPTSQTIAKFLDQIVERVGKGRILELGSGPGTDAIYLETNGASVQRTDGARSFVEMMMKQGFAAHQLDIRQSEFGGPFSCVLANAVLLHLSRAECRDFMLRIRSAIEPGGILAFTVKAGDGAGFTWEKLNAPRYFTYWKAAELRALLAFAGWKVELLETIPSQPRPWLQVIAAKPGDR